MKSCRHQDFFFLRIPETKITGRTGRGQFAIRIGCIRRRVEPAPRAALETMLAATALRGLRPVRRLAAASPVAISSTSAGAFPRRLFPAACVASKRALSSGSDGERSPLQPPSLGQRAADLARAANENRLVIITIGTATCAMYGFYRVLMSVTGFLLNVTDATVFNFGFGTGLLAAGAIGAAGVATHRYTALSVEGLRNAAFELMSNDPRVASKLGHKVREAQPPFRATVFESMRDALLGSERRARSSYLEMPARRCQLMFQVTGNVHDAMVSVEGFKRNGKYTVEAMTIFVTDTGEVLRLMGPETRNALFQGMLDLKLQSKRNDAPGPVPPAA